VSKTPSCSVPVWPRGCQIGIGQPVTAISATVADLTNCSLPREELLHGADEDGLLSGEVY
jgi:hypothetical protein